MRTDSGPSVADRLFAVIESCATSPRGLSLADLVDRTGLPKTTLHRSCWKLVELGMLEHGVDGFHVGTKMFALGCMNPDLRRLRVLGMPYMHELVAGTGQVVNLAVLSDCRALLVDEVFGAVSPSMPKMMGVRMPLHATAIGKALLLGREPEEVDEAIGTGALRPFTKHTIVRPELFREHLAAAARDGVVYSREEWRLGTSGLAVPVTCNGRTVAAMALIGPFEESELRSLSNPLRRAAIHFGASMNQQLAAA